MKKLSVNTIAKKLFMGSILSAVLFLSLSANAHTRTHRASNSTTSVDAETSAKVDVKYNGIDNSELLSFSVKYDNPTGGKFNLTIMDENGESLFNANYADKKFSKEFRVPKIDISKLTFFIRADKHSYKEVFNVNVNTYEVADVVVSKG